MAKRVLIVEDDQDIANLVAMHLKDAGFEPAIVGNGRDGLESALREPFDLVILDLMLPGLDGNEVLKGIRAKNRSVPILMLTLKSELLDKVLSLELGADDYLTKPFSIPELLARVKALVRRSELSEGNTVNEKIFEFAELRIDCTRRRVSLSGNPVELTPKQFDLLVFLAANPGRPYRREELLTYVWDYEHSGYEHTVDTHINRLRSRIEPNPSSPRFILTVWGVGYRFAEPAELKTTSQG